MSSSPVNNMNNQKPSLGLSILSYLTIALVYCVLSIKRAKDEQMMQSGTRIGMQQHTLYGQKEEQSQRATSQDTLVANSNATPFLIDAGIIQVILVITAIAFTIRAFTVTNTQALSLFGFYIFVDSFNITELANVVFIASGSISLLLYGVYLWEWMDRNIGIASKNRTRVWLVGLGLLAHLSFMVLLAAILILQILMRNVLPGQNT